jgi:tetratricopeptide (TPR) repeat protein
MNEIARRPQAAVPADVSAADVVADLARFQATILDQLAAVGLPTDGVLVSIDERDVLLTSLGGALRRLPDEDRGRSLYVSKMIVAAAVGLFDAALNYLWDETVNLEGARQHLERALAIKQTNLGTHHPEVGLTLANLGQVLLDQGDLEGARENLERALTTLEAALGADHPSVAVTLASLVHVLHELGA